MADVDCRWDIISASVDDRTRKERAEGGIPKSRQARWCSFPRYLFDSLPRWSTSPCRYASISSYISDCSTKYNYNDLDLVHNKEIYDELKQKGVKEAMAKHISHLFIRDTVSLFSEKIDQDDEKETDHFENIQSTNWQTMRFKVKSPRSSGKKC